MAHFRSVLVLVALILFCTELSAQVVSDFAANLDGWTSPNSKTPGLLQYSATGGNPNGYVFAQTPGSIVLGATTLWFPYYNEAPAKFEGNKSAYYGGNLRFDASQSTTGTPVQYAAAVMTDVTGIALYFYPATPFQPPSFGTWATFNIPLSSASGEWRTADATTGPAASQAQIQSVLNNIGTLQIQGLYRNANVVTRIDNVTMYPPIIINTQPVSKGACVGQTITFSTAASNNANIGYHWQFETAAAGWVDLTNTGGYSGVTTTTLSINTTGNFGAGNYRCRITGTAVDNAITSVATLTVNALPTAPTVTPGSRCGTGTVTLTAAGGAAGQYRWYTVVTGGIAIAGQTNATYAPSLSTTTNYYVAINNGTCESTRTLVVGTVNPIPGAPTGTGATGCIPGSVTLSASGGTAGQYRWYTVPVGGVAIPGQTNSTYTTPSLTGNNTYYVAINNGTCESSRTSVLATMVNPPGAPTTTPGAGCVPSTVTLKATGALPGQYHWYTVASGGSPIPGAIDSAYVTPSLSTNTTYYVAINKVCDGPRSSVLATLNPTPVAPTVNGDISCTPKSFTLTASGGTPGQYRWYTVPTGGAFAPNDLSGTLVTPVLSVTTTYYVAISNGTCESERIPVKATIGGTNCSNNTPPVIETTVASTTVGGKVTIDLSDLISDTDNNLDLSTLTIVTPPASGASASIDSNFNLVIDYSGKPFSGTESIRVSVCDDFGACSQQTLSIDVVASIEIFNAVSPNKDGKNDVFFIDHIDVIDATKKNHVTIFNRWGDMVWEGNNYDNTTVVFNGHSKSNGELPSGTYFYKIEFSSGKKTETGYLELKR